MVKQASEIGVHPKYNADGSLQMTQFDFTCFEGWNPKVRMFAIVEIEPGKEVEFHMHHQENEIYHFLSGEGLYNDNGTKTSITAGDTTFCPSGEGHGIINTGTELLRFVSMIVMD